MLRSLGLFVLCLVAAGCGGAPASDKKSENKETIQDVPAADLSQHTPAEVKSESVAAAEEPAQVDPAAAERQRKLEAIWQRNVGKLPEADAKLARLQRICPIMEKPLGAMGKPVKVDLDGRSVFICCAGCEEELRAKPAESLQRIPQVSAGGGQ